MVQIWLVLHNLYQSDLGSARETRGEASSVSFGDDGAYAPSPRQTYGYQERDEEKTTEFNQKLQEKEPKNLVDVDEAGFDHRDDYQTRL